MTAPDCLTCGACCSAGPDTVDLVPQVDDQVPEVFRTNDGRHMRTLFGKCLALRGIPDCRVYCAIYELRPLVCRSFEAGGEGCRRIRDLKGLVG